MDGIGVDKQPYIEAEARDGDKITKIRTRNQGFNNTKHGHGYSRQPVEVRPSTLSDI